MQNKPNVRFRIYTATTDDALGITYPALSQMPTTLNQGLEAVFHFDALDNGVDAYVDTELAYKIESSSVATDITAGKLNHAAEFPLGALDFNVTDYAGTGARPWNFAGSTDSFAISLWYKRTTSVGTTNNIFGYYGTDTAFYLADEFDAGNVSFYVTATGDTIPSAVLSPSITLAEDTWYHIVVTVDRDQSLLMMSINGTVYSTAFETSILAVGDGYFKIGGVLEPFQLDELAVWSRALNSGDFLTLYNSGSGMAYPFYSMEKFEGYLTDTYGRVEGRSASPNAQQDRTATHRIYVIRHPRYNATLNVYEDNLRTYFAEGNLIKIVEMRNPVSSAWETYVPKEEENGMYQISYVNNLDGFNYNLCGFLKEYGMDY